MSYLFVDSTYELSVGVLSDDLEWLSFKTLTGVKASAVIQLTAYELLKEQNIAPQDLNGIVIVNGPGFYTGLRLAEGFADVFKFFGAKVYSFYSYEIPYWCGFEKGTWFTKAYRGEYFLYQWNKTESHQKLLAVKELKTGIEPDTFFIHSPASLDDHSRDVILNPIQTLDLVKKHPKKIFTEVLKGSLKEPFYFRAPEDEFKVNP